MFEIMIWKDIKEEEAKRLYLSNGTDLDIILGLSKQSPKQNILLDLYLNVLHFSLNHHYHLKQFSTLFSIIKSLHEKCIKDNLTLDNAFLYLKRILLMHSVDRPPFSVEIFTISQIKDIILWISNIYFKQYKLYQYIFTDFVILDLVCKHVNDDIETIPELLPLNVALTQDEYDAIELKKKQEEEEKLKEKEALELKEELARELPEEIRQKIEEVVKREIEKLRHNI